MSLVSEAFPNFQTNHNCQLIAMAYLGAGSGYFASSTEIGAVSGMLAGTGLVVALPGFGSIVYETTPFVDELARYVSIGGVIVGNAGQK